MVQGRTLWELVEKRVAETPDALFVKDEGGRTLTFAGYQQAAERAAAGLAGMGVGEGTPVSWELPNWLAAIVLAGALSRLGAIQNPMLHIYRQREVTFMTRQTGARLLVVPPVWKGFDYGAMAHEVAGEVDGLEVLVVDKALPEGDPSTLPPPPAALEPDELPIRWRYYSSGTTADPKGIQHTDASVAAAARAMADVLEMGPEDRAALVFPFTHIAGAIFLISTMERGGALLAVEAFDPSTTIPFLAEEDVTLAGSVTPMHMAYLAAQRAQPDTPLFPKVRAFNGGGAPKPPQLHYDLKKEVGGVGIVSGYGLTECPILTMNTVRDPDEKLAESEGRVTAGVTIRLVDLDGREVGPNEEGEIRVVGPQLFKGYVESSLDAGALDEKGFLRTGDLGKVDDDGYVTITGRVKDIIIRKGENISAKEVEDLLYTHPKVADVGVIGLPDEERGEMACAVVAAKDASDPLTFEEMKAFLAEQGLMVQKIPERLEIVDAVPRNPTGKILKHQLRDQYAKGA
jgi:cyclohexanecarboxylate-CoA ligase